MFQPIFTLTIIKTHKKINNFQNSFLKKINFTIKCSSQQEKIQETFQIYFMVRLRDFRIKGNILKILEIISRQ